MKMNFIILDGYCILCSRLADFLIKRDKNNIFLFLNNESFEAKNLLKEFNKKDKTLEYIVYIKDKNIYIKSEAIFEIIKELSLMWNIFRVFRFLPLKFRDSTYDFVASNRYKIFGKNKVCRVFKDKG
ncbi:MAG: DUF393 domain-containing protein [Campylobacteraceae bacterium]|nr:DUF393 domain-containing protein [Campylobacteraceae bacterium]